MDVGVSLGVFLLALAAASFAALVLTGKDITWHRGDLWVITAYAVWAFGYFAYSWAASGSTARMALFGVRVVTGDGAAVSGRRAVLRTLALPLSFLFLGLGFAGILLGDRRRALHDVIAGTAVTYSWDARPRGCGSCPEADHTAAPAVPAPDPDWSRGCPGIAARSGGGPGTASASSTGIRVPSGLTARTGTLTSRTPLSYRAVTSAGSTPAGSLTARASDP